MIAYVLSGGAAAGSFQVGVLNLLQAKGIVPDIICGTSVGALNAAGYTFLGPIGLANEWGTISSWRDLYDVNLGALGGFADGILNTKPLSKIIARVVDGRRPKVPTYVTKTCVKTGSVVYSSSDEGSFAESVRASTAIPALISPVAGYADGGVLDNCPLKRAISMGADEIIAVLCSPLSSLTSSWEPTWKWLSMVELGFRAVEIMHNKMMIDDIESASKKNSNPMYRRVRLTIYSPGEEVCGPLEFGKASFARGFQMGLHASPKKW